MRPPGMSWHQLRRPRLPLQLHHGLRRRPRSNVVTIVTDNMTLAGDMVQDLCKFLQINELQSEAYFPLEMEALGKVLDDVSEARRETQRTRIETGRVRSAARSSQTTR